MKKQESKVSKRAVQGLPSLLHPRSWTARLRQTSALLGGAPGALQAGKDMFRHGVGLTAAAGLRLSRKGRGSDPYLG